MQTQLIKTKDLRGNTGQVPGLPMNPRLIRDDKFAKLVKSIKEDPEMLHLREVIAYDNDGQLIVICGNMRLRALQELGIKEVPTKILPKETSIEKLKAYTIKDNVGFGEHDWELLANEWDVGQLADWGLDIDTPKEVDAEKELIEDIIPDDDEEIFVQEGDILKSFIQGIIIPQFSNIHPGLQIFTNEAGDWNNGGFEADTGVTGRKLAVDNYGPQIEIGGGAFSGKDYTKVDRSGAYMARYMARHFLETKNLDECKVKIAYSIGVPEPVMVSCNGEIVHEYSLTPKGIREFLKLSEQKYYPTAKWGHFGEGFIWDTL